MKKPLIKEMTLREKIGQMLMLSQFERFEIDGTAVRWSDDAIKEMAEKEQFGSIYGQYSVVMKSYEFADIINREASFLKIPPLVGGDSEYKGAGQSNTDMTQVPGPLALGATDDEKIVFEMGAAIARELRCTGINWRWSPVVDISNRFSGCCLRTFTDTDVEKHSRLANAMIKGMQSEGVAATAKHFPGNDPSDFRDSHFSLSSMSLSKEEWFEKQGQIFQNVIDGGVYSIMIGHSSFPAIDNSTVNGKLRPSTASKKVITDLLKNEMGFSGVVISDDLAMGGIAAVFPYEDMIIECVNAGNDVLLNVKPDAGDIIEKAVHDGKIDESRIDDACQRVLDLKEKLGMFEEGYVNVKYKADEVKAKTESVARMAARKAVDLIRDRRNILPLDKSKIKKAAIIVSTHNGWFAKSEILDMKKFLEDRGVETTVQRRLSSEAEIKEISDKNDLIIYAAFVAMHMPKGANTLVGEECDTFWYAFKYGAEKSIGVSLGIPYLADGIMSGADAFVNLYGRSPFLMEAFVEGIFGEIPFTGKTPVNMKMPKMIFD
ncbi:MAG: glycoside hydrolase family 3 protein [Clostridia bacterium]|nr:glycoside hydrolase family 3 protein [Clostridia bacterium]